DLVVVAQGAHRHAAEPGHGPDAEHAIIQASDATGGSSTVARMSDPIDAVIEKWHQHLRGELPGGLDELLDDDVVFYSPIVYTPQEGKAITTLYLQAAGQTLPGDPATAGSERGDAPRGGFRYTKSVLAHDTAVLEFE